MSTNTTIVLVHGALTDASVWQKVNQTLQGKDYSVLAPALPMRSLAADIEYLSSFIATLGQDVLLVGHSYAGTVISAPAFATEQVNGLVYIAAFAPESGESTGDLNSRWPGSMLTPEAMLIRPYASGQDIYLKNSSFGEVYAHDLPASTVSLMASAQKPIEASALGESFQGPPAWRNKPSWMLITTEDRSLPPAAQRFMALRMGATISEVASSHAVPVSEPDEVCRMIISALQVHR